MKIINKREIIDKTDLILKGSRLKMILGITFIIGMLIEVLFGIVFDRIVIILLKLFLPMLLGALGFLFFIGVPTIAGMVAIIIFTLTSVIWILPQVAMANTIFYEKIKNKEESGYEY